MDDVALDEVLAAEAAPFWEAEDVFCAGSDLETPAVVGGTFVEFSAAAEGWEDVVGCCEALMGAPDCWWALDVAKEDCWIGFELTKGF